MLYSLPSVARKSYVLDVNVPPDIMAEVQECNPKLFPENVPPDIMAEVQVYNP